MVVAPILVLISAVTWAETTLLPLTDDVRINANKPTINFDGFDLLAHDYGPKQSLVRFDAASISGQTINSAVLELHLSSIRQNGTISLHAITSSWSEASATWNNQPPAEVAAAAIVNLTTGDAGGTIAIDVTATVQRWADGSLADAGFLIATNDDIKAFFDAKENAAGTPARLQVVTDDVPQPPPSGVGTPPVVLDLSNLPVVIDEPGHYVLDQDWEIDQPDMSIAIDMQARATIDLRGFEIDNSTIGGLTIRIGTAGGTVMNGRMIGNSGTMGVSSAGTTVIKDMYMFAPRDSRVLELGGARSEISNSDLLAKVYLTGDGISMVNSKVIALGETFVATGNGLRITGNTFISDPAETGPFVINGDNNLFSQNIIFPYEGGNGLTVTGNGNLVFGNTVAGSDVFTAIIIDGSSNVIKDNIVMPGQYGGVARVGISFLKDGNYFRNNQVAASDPFALGGTVQVDLGGNVGL
jgi:hypothetical protein